MFLTSEMSKAETIEYNTLDRASKSAIGLVTSDAAGLPRTFWQGVKTDQAVKMIMQQYHHSLPASRDFLSKVFLTELNAPIAKMQSTDFLHARVLWLLHYGEVFAANALIQQSNINTKNIFTLWFDVQLILNQPDQACRPLKTKQWLNDTIGIKIYCYAINQDWFTAELILANAIALNTIDINTASLLKIFLDPEFLKEVPHPPPSIKMNAFEYTLRNALALTIGRIEQFPTMLAHFNLNDNNGWLTQLRSAERLARTGGISPRYLKALYLAGKAPASGQLWERVRAVYSLNAAILSRQEPSICHALTHAWHVMERANMQHILAKIFAQDLSIIPKLSPCATIHLNMLLLHPAHKSLILDHDQILEPHDIRWGLLNHNFDFVIPKTPLEQAIKDAYTTSWQKTTTPALTILPALSDITQGIDSDPRKIKQLIGALLASDLHEDALEFSLQFSILK